MSDPAPRPSSWQETPHISPMMGFWSIYGRDCQIILDRRPHYCDRGNFLAKIFPFHGTELNMELDEQDGWPRYYFDLDRAKAEVEDWLKKRKQWVP